MATNPGTQRGIGLIGVGRHGTRYLNHLLHDVTGARLAAICRKRVADTLPLVPAGLPIYGGYRDLIADQNVQAVVVVTPASFYREICLAAVEAGKPLLIEKPLATTGEEARGMVAAAKEAGVLLMTAQTMRFDPVVLSLKEQFAKIGPLRSGMLALHIEQKTSEPILPLQSGQRGALLEIGIHLLDLVRFLSDEDVAEVQCEMNPVPSVVPETRALVHVRTVSGLSCMLDVARVSSGRIGRAEWIGARGLVVADWVQRQITLVVGDDPPMEWTIPDRPTIVAVLRAFLRAIETHTPPPVTGLDGCRAVELADACYESAARDGAAIPVR
jgi:predicted dehydrogenase